MEQKLTKFRKIFGSGPAGVAVSLVLFLVAWWFNRQINPPPLTDNQALLNMIFIVACLATLGIIVWGVRSLPPANRGVKLCTSGAFRYLRHPLYAAFLSVFDFGFAIWLNSVVFIVWAVLMHPVWHYLVRDEERMMIETFGNDYREYQKVTGRFFPRLKKWG